MAETQKSLFKPRFPEKYKGNPNNIVARSSWERVLMKWCDSNPHIVRWSSEELHVPYYDQASGKQRRYFPDFIIEVKRPDGSIETIMIEVKPHSQTLPPKQPKTKKMSPKTQHRLLNETATYVTNKCKWEAAEEYCRQRGWKFMIMTEKEIFGK